ncbi:hypothetical protein CAPTEDRAFT_67749, partial [Capitella teleta]
GVDVDDVYQGMDNGEVPFSVFIYLTKAFDCINHETLIKKLEYYGISSNSLALIKDYLTKR